jgi:predicted ATPase
MGRGASGEPKDTKTGEQRARTDLEQASHDEGSFTVVQNRFGEKEKLESYGG